MAHFWHELFLYKQASIVMCVAHISSQPINYLRILAINEIAQC